jgi:hypothetical protein
MHYLSQGDDSSPRGIWGICATALPEVLAMENAMTPALMIKSTGMIRSVTNATRWGILQHIAERSQTPMMMTIALQQRWLTFSRSDRRPSSP